MNSIQTHIIHELKVEIDTDSKAAAMELQENTLAFVKEQLLPELEALFDQITSDRLIRIDKLNLDLGNLDIKALEANILQQIRRQLPDQIMEVVGNKSDTSVIPTTPTAILHYFLQKGYFPWWTSISSVQRLEDSLLESIRAKQPMVDQVLLPLNDQELTRLVLQFSDAFFMQLLTSANVSTVSMKLLEQLRDMLGQVFSPRLVRNQYWSTLLNALFIQQIPLKQLDEFVGKELINQLSRKGEQTPQKVVEKLQIVMTSSVEWKPLIPLLNTLSNEVTHKVFSGNSAKQTPSLSEKKDKDVEETTYYINNAGLVILHPFINYFFEHLEYTKSHVFVDDYQQQQAALALQYLLEEKEHFYEPELILNKLLCGIAISRPMESKLIKSKALETQANSLLLSTIQYWSALKNTSPEGLRNTFLLREGKLSRKPNGDWKLFIQQQTVDILLAQLPWSTAMIKLPWMKNMLWVEWA